MNNISLKLTQKILEHIINKMLKHQNEWTDLFLDEVNDNYHAMMGLYKLDGTKVMICGWYYFTVKELKNEFKVIFHIAKCAK